MSAYFPVHIFQEFILAWYAKNRRDLPWRKVPRNPYHILVSELMLQQTQVSRVLPKFTHFISKWPTIESLADAKLSEVIIEWQGLGYNRRAKHLLETAKIIVHDYQGLFPKDNKELQNLPGFGPYMVSAIRVFAFGMQEPVLDVNVRRIQERTGLEPFAFPQEKADEWHQALMDFGSNICTAKAPACSLCPVSRICQANKEAQRLGFETYAQWLATQPKVKKISKKDIGKKFEETDRYFRGRIIDFLREGSTSMQKVQDHILVTHKLSDRKRFGNIIESLVVDGLIIVEGSTVHL
ncbi:MAG: A/G-specific adenine glycosylase [Candidatus Woesebacteria bacterium]